MKRSLLLFTLMALTTVCYSQTEYVITQVAIRTISPTGIITKEPYKDVLKKTTALLFSNELDIDGDHTYYLQLVRQVNVDDNDGGYLFWNALDGVDVCQVMLKDYTTYSTIIVHWMKSGRVLAFRTL